MRSASQLLHVARGAPTDPGSRSTPGAACRMCGAPAERGRDVSRWDGRKYLSAAGIKCMASRIICEACVLVCGWTTPLVMPVPVIGKPGNVRPPSWRMYSTFYDDGEVSVVSKGNKPFMRDWLARPKHGIWFAAISDSAQKHTVPWTPVNMAGQQQPRLFFEERVVDAPSVELLAALERLMTAGASQAQIDTCGYQPITIQLCGEEQIDQFEAAWGRHRGSASWDIALWLAQCEPEERERRDAERIERSKNKRGKRAKRSGSAGEVARSEGV